MVKFCFFNARAFTLTEILVGTLLVGVVFLGGASVHITALRFLGTAQQNSFVITTDPAVMLEDVARRISLSNQATITVGNSRLNVRSDYNCLGAPLNTPNNTVDDQWWHYRFQSSTLTWKCNGLPTDIGPAGPILISNVTTASSYFAIINPSGAGQPTVVNIRLVSTVPVTTLDTNVALGASAKR